MFNIDHSLEFRPPTTFARFVRQVAEHRERTDSAPKVTAVAPVHAPRIVELAQDELVKMKARRGTSISCVRGQLWITEDWNSNDVMLEPGETHQSTGLGRIVIVAFAPSAFRTVVASSAASVSRPWRFVADRLSVMLTIVRKRGELQASRFAH
jgi:hypothetical protein